ncbi:MAG: M20/M25/M40 family metallo-hydrolase [Candidatus Heimdallarchaeaceae archaeon]
MRSILTILDKLVSFETVNNPEEGIKPSRDILDYIGDRLFNLNYTNEYYSKDDYWTLVSYIKREGPTILFLGHCDVVPPGPNWDTNPFDLVIKNDHAAGRGSADMKGAVSVILSLADDFSRLHKGTIIFAITLDEESGGQAGAGRLHSFLQKKQLTPDYVINGDSNGLQIVTRRRNPFVISFFLPKRIKTIRGQKAKKDFYTEIAGNRTMHAAYFMKDIDSHCLNLASDFIKEYDYKISKLEGLFIKNNVLPKVISLEYIVPEETKMEETDNLTYDENLTEFIKSLKDFNNVTIPSDYSDYGINLTVNYYREKEKEHLFQIDLRIMSNNYEDVRSYFEIFIGSHPFEAKFDVKGSIGPVNTPDSSLLVQKAQVVAQRLSLASVPIEMGGATDSRFFSHLGVPTIEFGPLGGNVHGANEFVELSSLIKVKDFYLELVKELISF